MTKEELELFPTSESANRMLSYVTDGFYDRSYVGKWLYQVMGLEYDEAKRYAEELPYQFFPETATWGLKYHEIKWQLPVRENLSYEERRKLIYQKRDYCSPMTPRMMESYLESVTGFEVHIADVHDAGPYGFVPPHPNVFKAYFVGEETLNVKLIRQTLDKLKQSHTTYTINDRLNLSIDESSTESIRLLNVSNKFGIEFWGCRLFDGSWLFDGQILLDSVRRYCANISTMYRMEIIEQPEMADNITVETKTKNYWFFDGSVAMDGTRKFNSVYRKEAIE